MPTIGWFEILIIVVLAIIVLGPKDFPIMLKKVGSWIGSAKKYINNIQNEVSNIDLEENNIHKKEDKKEEDKIVKTDKEKKEDMKIEKEKQESVAEAGMLRAKEQAKSVKHTTKIKEEKIQRKALGR